MFNGCSKLSAAPALPAKSLENFCYSYMFFGCSNLKIKQEDIPTGEDGLIFICPSTSIVTTPVISMFAGTGAFTSDPIRDYTYYWYID